MSTDNENRIVDLLSELEVSTVEEIRSHLALSRPTVFRALGRHGYFSSLNYNAKYVTLSETPSFDAKGLWQWNDIWFSCYGTLKETVFELVRKADAGLTAGELQNSVGTHVHNQVSALCRAGKLNSVRVGRKAVYTSAREERSVEQLRSRASSPALRIEAAGSVDGMIPSGLSAAEIIALLVKMIEYPSAKPEQLVDMLRESGFAIQTSAVLTVVRFYGLEKKRAQWKLLDS